MSDVIHQWTDEQIRDIERRIHSVYAQARKDIEKKIDNFNKRYEAKEATHLQDVKDGKWTQEQFDNWKKGQVFQSKQWKSKRDEIVRTIINSNKVATDIVNGNTQNVFGENATYMNYTLDNMNLGFSFDIYDSNTVANLIKSDPQLLPKWKIDEKKDYVWNKKQVNNAVTQGIIQGESLNKISKRISNNLVMKNRNLSDVFARTAMTRAQNAGRQQSLKDAEAMGIPVMKKWIATLDHRTRDSHVDVDGEVVKTDENFSNGLEYPGGMGPPEEVYNCRCTMVAEIKGHKYKDSRTSEVDYAEWKKFAQKHQSAEDFKWNKNYVGTPNRQYGKADTSDAFEQILSGESNSLSNYLDKNGNLLPEREALHKQIIDNYLAGKTPQSGTATMTMMGGGPASGKSSVIKSGLYKLPSKKHSITIDPDDIKQYLPGYLKMSKVDSSAASFYHEESSMLAKQLASTSFTENYNVTYDGTGDGSVNSVMKKLNGAKDHGYQVNGMYVTVDTDEALRRNKSRYEHAKAKGEAPRLVPDYEVSNCHKKVTNISMEVSDQFDKISLYDNNGTSDQIKLIATGGNGKVLSAVKGEEEAFKRFLDKGK